MTATPRKGPGVTTMVAAAVIGNAFEFFDFTVFAAYLGYIGHAFYPNDNPLLSDLASAATFGIGFISRPVGGLVLGAYADRVREMVREDLSQAQRIDVLRAGGFAVQEPQE